MGSLKNTSVLTLGVSLRLNKSHVPILLFIFTLEISHRHHVRYRESMKIEGVDIQNTDDYYVCHINNFSDQLQEFLRMELRQICFGKALVDEDLKAHSYKSTLISFLERYERKTPLIKMGIMAELLAHLLITKLHPGLQTITVHFNKEERSIRKGFDLVFVDETYKEIWYGEVKSGETENNPDDKNHALLSVAKNDLVSRLSGDVTHVWDSVLIDTYSTLPSEIAKTVKKLLDTDLSDVQATPSGRKNGILISVVYYDTSDKITLTKAKDFHDAVSSERVFNKAVLFSFQKNTYSRIETFLRNEVAGA